MSQPAILEASRRRAVLVAAGCRTYVIAPAGVDYNYITCLCCGFRSYNQHDIDNLYCAYCHDFHITTIITATEEQHEQDA